MFLHEDRTIGIVRSISVHVERHVEVRVSQTRGIDESMLDVSE